MNRIVVHQDVNYLPAASDGVTPVQVFGVKGRQRGDVATIGHPLIDSISRLGVRVPGYVFDFLTLALAVTAADTFVRRAHAADGWTREIQLEVALAKPRIWRKKRQLLEDALRFLSGDIWNIKINSDGPQPPEPYRVRSRYRLVNLINLNSVCLLSGGLDSAVGAIDLLSGDRKPLLVSNVYPGDGKRQAAVVDRLLKKFSTLSWFAASTTPRSPLSVAEITMRTRSIIFLALGAVGVAALAEINGLRNVELNVPENGFISLNVPLTSRRIGSLSTRTTHPHFLGLISSLLEQVNVPVTITNRYQFKTKGEMLCECANADLLRVLASETVSCSNWKRKHKQCGRCVPCLVRRAALAKARLSEPSTFYQDSDLAAVARNREKRDDLFALISAIEYSRSGSIRTWISDSGPLSTNADDRERYASVFIRGLAEIECFLRLEGVY